jgi:hypothetical protein
MTEDHSRRQLLEAVAGVATVGLAGCLTGGEETRTETVEADESATQGAEDDTATSTPTSVETSGGFDGMTSRVEELAVVSAEQDVADEGDPSPTGTWLLHLGVHNSGEEETDVMDTPTTGRCTTPTGTGWRGPPARAGTTRASPPRERWATSRSRCRPRRSTRTRSRASRSPSPVRPSGTASTARTGDRARGSSTSTRRETATDDRPQTPDVSGSFSTSCSAPSDTSSR